MCNEDDEQKPKCDYKIPKEYRGNGQFYIGSLNRIIEEQNIYINNLQNQIIILEDRLQNGDHFSASDTSLQLKEIFKDHQITEMQVQELLEKEKKIDLKLIGRFEKIKDESKWKNSDSSTCSSDSRPSTWQHKIENDMKAETSTLHQPFEIFMVKVRASEPFQDEYSFKFRMGSHFIKRTVKNEETFPIFIDSGNLRILDIKYTYGRFRKTQIRKNGISLNYYNFIDIEPFHLEIKHTGELIYLPGPIKNQILSDKYVKNMLFEFRCDSFIRYHAKILPMIAACKPIPRNEARTFVRDLRGNKFIDEIMEKKMEYFFKFVYTERLANMFLYRFRVNKMSIAYGKKYDDPSSAKIIKEFVQYYGINMDEFSKAEEEYKTFNEFFARELKLNARTLECKSGIASPGDCRISAYTDISLAKGIFVKGKNFTIQNLIKNSTLCNTLFICRLAPQDYHRFHSPFPGRIRDIKKVHGDLLTVHPSSLKKTDVLTDNLRVIIHMDTPFGEAFVVAVGASLVGSIVLREKKGDIQPMEELGYFQYGGSMVIIVFKERLQIHDVIRRNSMLGIETYTLLGDCIAQKNKE